jgi:glycosyltransferase involved in cell wall biosynthesis
MKICFFNTTRAWGGGEKWHFDHALAFLNDSHQVVVVSNKKSELLAKANAYNIQTKRIKVSNLSFLNPIKFISLFLYFKKERFDVIVMNFSKDLKVAAPAAKLAGIPKIVYRRGSAIPIRNTLLNRMLFRFCLTNVLANSEATKKTILQHNANLFPVERIKVIYNGVLVKGNDAAMVANDVPVVGNLGRMVYQKGQELIIDIAEILKNRSIKCKFVIGGDGELMGSLKQKVAEKKLTDYIDFVGFVDDSALFMSKIDIFILTSRWEGFGYVLAEAMLAKKPVLGFNISSNPELIQDNKNGFLIPFEDKEAFANAIELLINNPQKRKAFGEEGYRLVCERFDFEKNKQLVVDFLSGKK